MNNKSGSTEPNSSMQIVEHRGLTKAVLSRYKIQTLVEGDTPKIVEFPYPSFTKNRVFGEKKFFSKGTRKPGVFGKEAFDINELKDIVITEGEYDAPSVFQMIGIPGFSVQSATTAVEDCRADFEYLNRASRIFIAIDADEAGQKVATSVASLFDFSKVFKIEMRKDLKDANGYLQANEQDSFRKAFKASKKFVPDGVISTYEEIKKAFQEKPTKPVCSFPFARGEEKLEGLRLGTSVLISGLEGIGKTELVRALEYQVLKETDYNIGIIHLEEPKQDALNCLLSYHVKAPLRREKFDIPIEQKMEAFEDLVKRDNRVHVYSHFGSNDPDSILGIVRFLGAVCDCKFIFLDHINIIASGLDSEKDERRVLDYLCTHLAFLVEELNICLVFVCHENDDGRPRGSRNMGQVAKVRIRLSRDLEAQDDDERNKLYMVVSKNRPTGATGPIGYAYFDPNSGYLSDVEQTERPF